MDLLFILLILAIVSLYFAPFMFESLRVIPFITPISKVKNTIIFGVIGVIFSQQIEPFPILNVFMGMIAGSFIDYLMKE
ncbi:hypothetical protein [Aquibacillus sediminis]|uniref:hypothetical protein n=1 Tax=Aquibacillus sediminis TaxID=2574734 RepID=UPI001107D65D|nr:hypothetical protein [Aquibacillus sediminis]